MKMGKDTSINSHLIQTYSLDCSEQLLRLFIRLDREEPLIKVGGVRNRLGLGLGLGLGCLRKSKGVGSSSVSEASGLEHGNLSLSAITAGRSRLERCRYVPMRDDDDIS